jgi:DNA ligase-1
VRRLAALFDELDATTSTTRKVELMASYFLEVPPEDGAWGLYLLMGQKLKRLLPARAIARWVQARTNTPEWLFRECYGAVGDLAETVCLLMDDAPAADASGRDVPLHEWVERAQSLRTLDESSQKDRMLEWLEMLPGTQRFLLLKLATGSLRVGVSRTLVERAIAAAAKIEKDQAAHRLAGDWKPTPEFFSSLRSGEQSRFDESRPYPFFLASPLDAAPSDDMLGSVAQWQLEWKWDGIRAQLIRRGVSTHLWSRGDELLTARFPEVVEAAARLPAGTVLDGEVLAWREGQPLGFAALQRRIGRTALSARILSTYPAAFVAYDILEADGADVRTRPLAWRRATLEQAIGGLGEGVRTRMLISPLVEAPSWEAASVARGEARVRGVEGLMIKRRDSGYASGRTKGDWWKWKIDPYTFDGVLTHAEPGHGRRAGLLTDYTFAVWDGESLVPVTRAYSGLSHEEIKTLDTWIHRNTTGRFGPAREVKPLRVFEIAFEGIAASTRHRSGVALRFPRISRIRDDKPAAQADTLQSLQALIKAPHAAKETHRQLGLFADD